MFNKNDPLIGAVQQVMQSSNAERAAAKAVNEKFGVVDRKALPREKQPEWDAAYKQILSEELKGNQHKIDANKNGKVDGGDFKLLKKGVRPMEEEGDPSKAIRGDDVTGGSSVTTVKSKEKTITPADQSALKKKIQSIKENKSVSNKVLAKIREKNMQEGMLDSIKNFVMNPQGIKGLPSYKPKTNDAISKLNSQSSKSTPSAPSTPSVQTKGPNAANKDAPIASGTTKVDATKQTHGPNAASGQTSTVRVEPTSAPPPAEKKAAPPAQKKSAPPVQKKAAPPAQKKVVPVKKAPRLQSKTQRDDIAGPTRK